MTEGGVYLALLVESGSQYRLELVSNREVSATADSLEGCIDELGFRIAAWNGDGEAVFEILDESESQQSGRVDLLVATSYNEHVEVTDQQNLFSEGYCPKCRFGRGVRTDTQIDLERAPLQPFCGVRRVYPNLRVYSKEFIGALREEECAQFEKIPVTVKQEPSNYIELVPRTVIPYVGVKGGQYPVSFLQGWLCTDCGRTMFKVITDDYPQGATFLHSRELPDRLDLPFAVNVGMSTGIVFARDRWTELITSSSANGLLSAPVVVIPEDRIEMPSLPTPDEFDWI